MTQSTTGELRRHFRKQRRAIGSAAQIAHAEAVARAVVNAGAVLRAATSGLYLAYQEDGELDTLPLLSRLWSMSRIVACPVIGAEGEMDLYRTLPTTRLVANRFGILEPSTRGRGAGRFVNPLSLSVLFMPLVAFDETGTRLGMGAGYYDRYLGRLSGTLRPLLVGLAHEAQRSNTLLPRNVWDVPLDAVATESGWQPFTRRAMV